MHTSLKRLTMTRCWPGMEREQPLTMAEGASEEPFDSAKLQLALQGPSKSYRCGGSFWWLNLAYSPART